MKKVLYLSALLFSISLCAQDFWTEFSTAQPTASTGVSSISMVSNTTTWLSMSCGTVGCTPIRRYAKTTNGGNSWTTQEIDLGPNTNQLLIANISGVSDQVAYAAVYPNAANVFGGIWQTIDGGNSWQKQSSAVFTSPNYSFPDLVHFWNANDGVAVGDPADGYFEMYTTADSGNNWSRVPMSVSLVPLVDYEYGVVGGFTVNGNSLWAFTTFGRIIRTTDRGLTWSVFQSPIPDTPCCFCDPNLRPTMAFTDENNGLLLSTDYQLFKTSDGGETWSIVDWSGVLRDFSIAPIPGVPNAYICLGTDWESGIDRGSSYSIDGGYTWININNHPDLVHVNGSRISMLNEDFGFAGGFNTSPTEGGIFRWGGGPMLRNAILAQQGFEIKASVGISPNPARDRVYLQTDQQIIEVKLYDLTGRLALQLHKPGKTIALNALSSGAYLLEIQTNHGVLREKLIKE
ncbi:T9SS type A sorting domain-containing protein [Flavobacterium sp. CYK-55]|uniref:YCF48-related protein n=1 Tax=Flavobacterium sp. CYK-55 TaxID=2835529 RepID=UPI001BCFECD8|nr:YCF48-related protein [Flavobacterium sp. CYK-55]MBS7788046.1 T9SS type A sorting domain-containing protein [Flavobacterium sp. CYK-55]